MGEAIYRDFWTEFHQIQLSLRRCTLRKQNFNEIIKQFKELAEAMEDAEMPEHAANCQREMAFIYGKFGNVMMEKQCLLKAAHLFFDAMIIHGTKTNVTSFCEFSYFMEECYLIVVEKMLKQSCSHLVACTFMEMATQFELLHNYTKSFEYLIKARHLAHDTYTQLQVLTKLLDIIPKQSNSENAFAELDAAWNSLPKTEIVDEIRTRFEHKLNNNHNEFILRNDNKLDTRLTQHEEDDPIQKRFSIFQSFMGNLSKNTHQYV